MSSTLSSYNRPVRILFIHSFQNYPPLSLDLQVVEGTSFGHPLRMLVLHPDIRTINLHLHLCCLLSQLLLNENLLLTPQIPVIRQHKCYLVYLDNLRNSVRVLLESIFVFNRFGLASGFNNDG